MSLFVGYEVGTGKAVKVPIFFMLVTGQTRLSGKTTILKALAKQAVDKGFKILVIDSKTNITDYEGFGQEVPICLQESTDSLVLIGLLESLFQRKITKWFATLTHITEGASTFADVIENAKILREKTRAGFVKDACSALIDLLVRLKEQTEKRETTPNLVLPYDINRMTINEFKVESQQLIAKSVFQEALKQYKKLIIILDEAYKFLPQKWSSACKKAVQDYVTQGGATECFMWMGSQFLATTSKDAMKTMAIKLLGRQDHDTEAQHTLDLIPYSRGVYDNDFIMRLQLGHFIVVTIDDVTKNVYTVPEYADKNLCKQVALGIRKPRDIQYVVPLPQIEAKPPEKKKKKIKVKVKAPKKEEKKPVEKKARKPKPAYISGQPSKSWKERFELIDNNIESLRLRLIKTENQQKAISDLLQTLKISPDMTLEEVVTKVSLRQVIKNVTVSDDTVRGQILALGKEGFFKTEHPLRDVVNALEQHHWTVNYDNVKSELVNMANDGLLGMRKKRRENYYALSPNIIFED